jgi:hypothetical protein
MDQYDVDALRFALSEIGVCEGWYLASPNSDGHNKGRAAFLARARVIILEQIPHDQRD